MDQDIIPKFSAIKWVCVLFMACLFLAPVSYSQSEFIPILPEQGVTFQQIDIILSGVEAEISHWGRVEVSPSLLRNLEIEEGFLNIFTEYGWVVQNLFLQIRETGDPVSTYFALRESPEPQSVQSLPASVVLSREPLPEPLESAIIEFPVTPRLWSAEGASLEPVEIVPEPPQPVSVDRFVFDIPTTQYTQPNKSNVQAAVNQCVPMAIANSLEYLKDRFGLAVPHEHKMGLKGDESLVGQLGETMDRDVTNRLSGAGMWFTPMLEGKFAYLAEHNLGDQLIQKHQGRGWGSSPDEKLPAGDFTSSGITSESQGETVTFEWICEQIRQGEDVEVIFEYDGGGGHAMRAFECGTTFGIPWVGFANDSNQFSDSNGLECVRFNMLDLDGDGTANLGSTNWEVRFAMSESMKDGVATPTEEPGEQTPTTPPTPTFTPTLPESSPTYTPTPTAPDGEPTDCTIYYSIEGPHTLANGATSGDIILHRPNGSNHVLVGGSNPELLLPFRTSLQDKPKEVFPGLDAFDIITLAREPNPDTELYDHEIIFCIEFDVPVTNTNHPLSGTTVRGGDILFRNGGVIRNEVLMQILQLQDEEGNLLDYIGIDAIDAENFQSYYSKFANEIIETVDQLVTTMQADEGVTFLLSLEASNDKYIAGPNSFLPSGMEVSADDAIAIRIDFSVISASVIGSGHDQIPTSAPGLLQGFSTDGNVGLDALSTCSEEDVLPGIDRDLYFSTSFDDFSIPVDFFEGDLLFFEQSTGSPSNQVILTNFQLTGQNEEDIGLDAVDMHPFLMGIIPTPTPGQEMTDTPVPEPTDTPISEPTITETPTPTSTETPVEPTSTPRPTFAFENLVVAQGFGGRTLVNIRNFNPEMGALTSVLNAFQGPRGTFLENIGGGAGRSTFLSSGDLNQDGTQDVVLSFGSIRAEAVYPNIVIVRDSKTREVIGHPFTAFPKGSELPVQYNGGEIRTAVGNFTGAEFPQIATAQGEGGNGAIRLYQYTDNPPPNAWQVVGQFYGLPSKFVHQVDPETGETVSIALSLEAGDVDMDGRDELLVGQTNGPQSQTIFFVYDIDVEGGIAARHAFTGFVPRFQGNGGITMAVADLNGDNKNEILVASQGNTRDFGDLRDEAAINVIAVLIPKIASTNTFNENNLSLLQEEGEYTNRIEGFRRPDGAHTLSVFPESVNPSGAVSLTAGELVEDLQGDELVVGTDSVIRYQNGELVPVLPAPQAKYSIIKIQFDGDRVEGFRTALGPPNGFPAFVGDNIPASGGIDIEILPAGVEEILQPEPPMTLQMGEFQLEVENYDQFEWNESETQIRNASGFATTSFNCDPSLILPPIDVLPGLGDILTNLQTFQVVETVNDPQTQISLEEARQFSSGIGVGENLSLFLPSDFSFLEPLTFEGLSNSLQIPSNSLPNLVGSGSSAGQTIRVRFSNVEIDVGSNKDEGTVTTGKAVYPANGPKPVTIKLNQSGMTTELDRLEIYPSPQPASASATLVLPSSINSASSCKLARVDLGTIDVGVNCDYYKELPEQDYGLWTVGNTNMEIYGKGVVADFSTQQSWTINGATPTADWKGAVLISGQTKAGSEAINISNTGYLKAPYTYENALIYPNGMMAALNLSDSYSFHALQPFGYEIDLSDGQLDMLDSEIQGGLFSDSTIWLPEKSVRNEFENRTWVDEVTLVVQNDLSLYSDSLNYPHNRIKWGELTLGTESFAFESNNPSNMHFYLASTPQSGNPIVNTNDNFHDFDFMNTKTTLMDRGIQGLTILRFEDMDVLTNDTPGAASIQFESLTAWLNVAGRGVHGRFRSGEVNQPLELGPTYQPFYKGEKSNGDKEPFRTTIQANETDFLADFKFVDSAMYESNASGFVQLATPTNDQMPFDNLQVTSSAHLTGAKVVSDSTNVVKLGYWQLDMVQKQTHSSAGVMSFKTGEIFFTGAGIEEPVHYSKPFFLTWGKILSSGLMGQLDFDKNSIGQKFDGFPHSPNYIALSEWKPGNKVNDSFLKTIGEVYYPFFTSNNMHIQDNFTFNSNSPFFNRRIELLDQDVTVNLGSEKRPNQVTYKGTERKVARTWGNGFGGFDFDITYDSGDQNGFLGNGNTTVDLIGGGVPSSMIMSGTRVCVTISDITGDNHHDITLGVVGNFTGARTVRGCVCFTDADVLETLHLSGETSALANLVVRAGKHGKWSMTASPETSKFRVNGNLFLTLVAGTADIVVDGLFRTNINRQENFVEGTMEGGISTTQLGGAIDVDGRLDWHLAKSVTGDDYMSLQGRIGMKQMIGALGFGIGSSAEAGFYFGANAPRDEAWVLREGDPKFRLNVNNLPQRLTGFYGFLQGGGTLKLGIINGGMKMHVGAGIFLPFTANANDISDFRIVGNLGAHVWGEILWGLLRAGAWVDLQVFGPLPPAFEGSVGLEGCVAFVCGEVELTVGLNENEGLIVEGTAQSN